MVTTTNQQILRALVVDDDPIVRQILNAALSNEGFECEMARNGQEAAVRLTKNAFDLLVTDLRMPEKNGHALAVDILEQTPRPVIIVHSGVTEPKIARDLILRGVDDVVPKPTDYSAMAAKAWGLVERRRATEALQGQRHEQQAVRPEFMPTQDEVGQTAEAEPTTSESATGDDQRNQVRLSSREIQARLMQLKSLMPLSNASFDVYSLATQDAEVDSLREAIERDATLAAEVLKLANSAYCASGHRKIDNIDDAIIRLGRQSMGELALLVSVRQGLSSHSVPWIDRKLLWRRSIAAGIAARHLSQLSSVDDRKVRQLENAMQLCALLSPVGRLALAALFPDEHRQLVEQCQATGTSLDSAERQQFGLTHYQVAARLMSIWNLPRETRTFFEQCSRPFDHMESLSGDLKHFVERLKLAILIGQLASADWRLWDAVDVPAQHLLIAAGVESLEEVVEAVREQLDSSIGASSICTKVRDDAASGRETAPVVYRSSLSGQNDTLRILLKLAGVTLLDSPSLTTRSTVINGVSSTETQIADAIRSSGTAAVRVIRAEQPENDPFAKSSTVLPASLHEILA